MRSFSRGAAETGKVEIFGSALLQARRLKLISALNIISAAKLCPSGLAVGVINVCLPRGRAAGDKQAYKEKSHPRASKLIFRLKGLFDGKPDLAASRA
jgi:hypothetical protein